MLDEGTDAEGARNRDGGVRQGRRLRSEPRLHGARLRAQPAAKARSLLRDRWRRGAASANARARRISRFAREGRAPRRSRPSRGAVPATPLPAPAPRGRRARNAARRPRCRGRRAVGARRGSRHRRRYGARAPAPTAAQTAAAAPIWASLLDDDMPVLVVVGDYYIFGELDDARRRRAAGARLHGQLEQGARRHGHVRRRAAREVHGSRSHVPAARQRIRAARRAQGAIHVEQARARRDDVGAQRSGLENEPRRLRRLHQRARQARGLRVRVLRARRSATPTTSCATSRPARCTRARPACRRSIATIGTTASSRRFPVPAATSS